jgi:cytoskeletal protein CcmA (bactofilin family)
MWMKDKTGSNDADRTTDENDQDGAATQAEDVIAFVGKGVEFKGTITYNGTVRIDGILDGEIHTDGTLLIGEEAVLTAKVSAGTVISKGKITGDISAKEKVRLLSPAILNGSVKAPTLSMEEGVLFNGSIEMARAEVRELSREAAIRAAAAPAPGVKRVTG